MSPDERLIFRPGERLITPRIPSERKIMPTPRAVREYETRIRTIARQEELRKAEAARKEQITKRRRLAKKGKFVYKEKVVDVPKVDLTTKAGWRKYDRLLKKEFRESFGRDPTKEEMKEIDVIATAIHEKRYGPLSTMVFAPPEPGKPYYFATRRAVYKAIPIEERKELKPETKETLELLERPAAGRFISAEEAQKTLSKVKSIKGYEPISYRSLGLQEGLPVYRTKILTPEGDIMEVITIKNPVAGAVSEEELKGEIELPYFGKVALEYPRIGLSPEAIREYTEKKGILGEIAVGPTIYPASLAVSPLQLPREALIYKRTLDKVREAREKQMVEEGVNPLTARFEADKQVNAFIIASGVGIAKSFAEFARKKPVAAASIIVTQYLGMRFVGTTIGEYYLPDKPVVNVATGAEAARVSPHELVGKPITGPKGEIVYPIVEGRPLLIKPTYKTITFKTLSEAKQFVKRLGLPKTAKIKYVSARTAELGGELSKVVAKAKLKGDTTPYYIVDAIPDEVAQQGLAAKKIFEERLKEGDPAAFAKYKTAQAEGTFGKLLTPEEVRYPTRIAEGIPGYEVYPRYTPIEVGRVIGAEEWLIRLGYKPKFVETVVAKAPKLKPFIAKPPVKVAVKPMITELAGAVTPSGRELIEFMRATRAPVEIPPTTLPPTIAAEQISKAVTLPAEAFAPRIEFISPKVIAPVPITIPAMKPMVAVKPAVAPLTAEKLEEIVVTRPYPRYRYEFAARARLAAPLRGIAEATAQQQQQLQKQEVIQRQRLTEFRKQLVPKEIITPAVLPRLGEPAPRIKPRRIERRLPRPRGYKLLVKEKGKFKRVGKTLSYNDALDLGADLVDNTPSARFKIIPTDEPAKIDEKVSRGYFQTAAPKFRPYKIRKGQRIPLPLGYIERRGKPRIDTKGELEGITVKGHLAKKRKRAFKFF